MYKLLSTLTIAALVLASCNSTNDPVGSASTNKDQNQIQSNTVEQQELDLSGTFPDSCTGEDLAYDGTAHVTTSTKINSNGDTVISTHINLNLAATGVTSGKKYQIIEVASGDAEYLVDGCPSTYSQDVWLRATTAGKKNNLLIRQRFVYNIDCDGNFNVEVDETETSCQ